MKKLPFALSVIIVSTLFVSCQKEVVSDIQGGAFSGTYKFISMQVNSISTVQADFGVEVEKTVTISHYLSKDNSGTIKFEGSRLTSTDLSYSIDTIIKVYSYLDDVLYDSLDMTFQFSVPPSSATAPYKMIGSDSLYLSSGSMFMGDTTQQTVPVGYKIRTEGDKLYMTYKHNSTSTQDTQGITIVSTSEGSATSTFQKVK